MASQVHSTSCTVTIVTPEGVRWTFRPQDAVKDLLAVQTHNDKAEACGSFTLTFVPRVIDGKTYDELIPMRSVVTIALSDPLGQLSDADSVVMVGITDDHGIDEDWSRAQPRRIVTISGRSMAAQLVDAQLLYHPSLEKGGGFTLSVGETRLQLFWEPQLVDSQLDPRDAIATILRYYLGVGDPPPSPSTAETFEQPSGSMFQAFVGQDLIEKKMAINPTLTADEAKRQVTEELTGQVIQRAAPVSLPSAATAQGATQRQLQAQQRIAAKLAQNPTLTRAKAALEVADELQNGVALSSSPGLPQSVPHASSPVPGGKQLMNMQLPEKTLADLLSANPAEWTLFEDGLTCFVAQNSLYSLSVWNYIHLFVDTLFQEFFTRMESGVCKILFRAKPFTQTPVTAGTRFRTDDPTCQTLEVSPGEDVTVVSRHRQSTNVLNDFLVVPINGGSTLLKDKSFEVLVLPTILTDPTHVSFVGRYGIRALKHASPYLSGLPTIPDTPKNQSQPSVVDACQRWGKIAAAWYDSGAKMYAGFLRLRGSPRWNPGHRLLYRDTRGAREAYIEGVDHAYDFQTGRYSTQLRVTRMWYLEGPIDVPATEETGDVEVIEMVGSESRERFDVSTPALP